MSTEDKSMGVIVTIKDIHENVTRLVREVTELNGLSNDVIDLEREHSKLEERTRRLEAQNAAHWVVHVLTVGAIASAIGKVFL